MPRVARLTEALINKIAAGEVVERPASVVKELCENALDAGARNVRVRVEDGGLSRISVADDGVGMAREDARLALERHATSKLKDLEGLFSIETMGFRGEALPAIAAVSRFSLTTSEAGAPSGTRMEVEGGAIRGVADAAPVGGTVVEVQDLFFNVPARRKYMKQTATELKHVEDAVLRLALAHPEVGFFLESGGRPLLSSPGGAPDASLRERLAAAIGADVHPHLLEVSEERLGVSVGGLVASPEYSLPSARGLYTFVNRRYVRDRGLLFAIQRAFSPLLPQGRQPVGAVFIEVDPHAVDVNVHPQKLEVRFADGRGVADAVHQAVGRAVKSAPWLNQGAAAGASAPAEPARYAMAVEQFLARAAAPASGAGAPLLFAAEPGRAPAFGEARPERNGGFPPGFFGALRFLGELSRRFWACEGPGGTLVVLDAHAAFERVYRTTLGEELARRRDGREPLGPTLFSTRVELPEAQARAVLARSEPLRALGISVEPFGPATVAVSPLTNLLGRADFASLLPSLIEVLPAGTAGDGGLGGALALLSCHSARGEERAHGHEEARTVLGRLDEADFTLSCRHRGVVVMEVPFLELVRRAEGKS